LARAFCATLRDESLNGDLPAAALATGPTAETVNGSKSPLKPSAKRSSIYTPSCSTTSRRLAPEMIRPFTVALGPELAAE